MADPKLIKICLTNKGEDTETPWAHELGPAPNAPSGSVRVKLVNVPFMHAKPTWGDTIVVSPKKGEFLTWDRDGVPWKQIQTRIVEDGGRWAMILDYLPRSASNDQAFAALGRACEVAKIICEGAWGPRESDPGRAYLAVQKELNAEQVMGILEGAALPLHLIQVHPEPKKKPAGPPPRVQTVVGISDEAGRPPARAKTEPPVSAETPVSKRAATNKPPTSANASSALKKGAKAATKAAAKEVADAEKAASKEAAAAAKAAAAKKAAAEKAAVEKAAAKAAQVAVKAALAKQKPAAKKPAPPAKKPAKKSAKKK